MTQAAPRALILDLDGTMVDNMGLHDQAFTAFLSRHGRGPLTADERARLDGKRNRDIFPVLFGRALTDEEQVAFAGEKEALYRDLSHGKLVPAAGLIELLARAEANRVHVAVATSAPAENVLHTLHELGLGGTLPVVRGDEVPRGKPFPDIFLAAAERLGVPPERCVVVEDAPAGIAAGRAAGMTVVAITTNFPAAQLAALDPPPHVVVGDFRALLEGPHASLLALA